MDVENIYQACRIVVSPGTVHAVDVLYPPHITSMTGIYVSMEEKKFYRLQFAPTWIGPAIAYRRWPKSI